MGLGEVGEWFGLGVSVGFCAGGSRS
jgi:hypothetical protein